MNKRLLLPLFLLLPFLHSAQSAFYFPPKTGTAWQNTDPATLDFCPDRIDSLYHFLETRNTKSFILLKDGKIVLEKYFGTFTADSLWYWASAGKSMTAFLTGQAQEEGLLSIDDPTSDYLGNGWTSCPPDKEALITVKNQLSMTSGLDDIFTPTPTEPEPNLCKVPACLNYLADAGTRWAYHTGPYRLLHDVIASASGVTINQFTKTRLLDPTGMKGLWAGDVYYSRTRDMARFGLLTLAGGIWDGDTLLHDQSFFYDMTHRSQELNKSYGYLWWLNGQESFMIPSLQIVFPGKLIPNAPNDMFAALGKNDQKIHVVPSKGWVVIRMGNAGGFNVGGDAVPIVFDNEMWGYLNQLVCVPTGIPDLTNRPVRIWPDPVDEQLTVDFGNTAGLEWSVFSTTGQFMASGKTAAGQFNLSTQNWQSGAYFIRLMLGKEIVVKRFVVEHR